MLAESKESSFGVLFSLREELDRWLGAVRGGNGTWSPAVDMYAEEGELYLEVELPGVDSADVEILSEGQELTVRAMSTDPRSPKGAEMLERRRGTYERSLFLPVEWDPSAARASLKDGVLTLRIPRAPEPEGAQRISLDNQGAAARKQPTPIAAQAERPAERPAPERPNLDKLIAERPPVLVAQPDKPAAPPAAPEKGSHQPPPRPNQFLTPAVIGGTLENGNS